MTQNEEDVLEEAMRLTSTDRQGDYGHPLDDFGRTAGMFNALFADKLKSNFSPEDLCIVLVLVKLSREANTHKRDNIVDGAGYLRLVQMIKDEREDRLDEQMADVYKWLYDYDTGKLVDTTEDDDEFEPEVHDGCRTPVCGISSCPVCPLEARK